MVILEDRNATADKKANGAYMFNFYQGWFYSSLSSILYEPYSLNGILLKWYFHVCPRFVSDLKTIKKFGEWHKIIVDEQLPLKIFEKKKAHGGFRRGNTFQPEKVEDYWALLLEKVTIYDSDLAC